ncbi:glutaredoxin-1 [Cantharellus anzutake]|uniref:glutaredoxin-1 n=1 Tax=Cantharellus anzutake TaxID=1750568 RepID=UPI0019051DFB|nr:glutaredoxin-1 [Cantharellus anzutake]KAF8336379.1 glutaredoxin-1 [Cantharellus anzutake]
MSVKQFVEDAIAENDVVVFSKSWCGYSRRAKSLIKDQPQEVLEGKKVKVIELDEKDDGDEIQSYLLSKTGQRTVPNVFINQKHIGGNDDLQALHRKEGLPNVIAGTA